MSLPHTESGLLLDQFPFVRIGEGIRTLVVFPGINDALEDAAANPKFAAWFCQSFARRWTVYVISRKHGLPPGYSTRDMARDYQRVFEDVTGRSDVFGVSMGSAIAQHFAADYPEYVNRLVLGMAGPCLAPETRGICRRWIELARDGQWRELYLELIARTYGASRRAVFEVFMPKAENMFARMPSVASDFIVSTEACMRYDTTDRLAEIRAPTLVLGGTKDQLMPVESFCELAERIPHATLRLFEDAGHGLFEECKDEFDRIVGEFLDQS